MEWWESGAVTYHSRVNDHHRVDTRELRHHVTGSTGMTAFPSHKLSRLTTTRNARADTINTAIQIAGENIYCLDAIINTTLPAVEREAEEFRDYLGEPLPAHANDALDREITNWRLLRDSLDLYRLSDPTDEDAARYVTSVRRFLGYQHDLVRLQAEMLQSCLSRHYREQVHALAALMSQVPL